ncbi:PRC-barrel domain-containing protein [Cellulosimicrobium cellulans]|uniref:PRC-barrel domain-containing protein n=1 Tax=Cellulosimicrobium cellulans TaxID=1710 RepID=UPI0008495BE5|nr:PRC-barrel domain-containing protein [Cellulosimicrobium cellulans]
MISTDQIERLLSDGTVVSRTGEKIGKVGQVFLDDSSGRPEWVTVRTGLFGSGESFVPLGDADVEGDEIRVPFGKDDVKGAPRVDDDGGHLSPEEEGELYRYYGRLSSRSGSSPDASRASGEDDRPGEAGVVGRHAAGPADREAPDGAGDEGGDGRGTKGTKGSAGTAGTEGTVRLRRYVVTEYVTQAVPGEGTGGADASPGQERTITERVREEVVETDPDDSGRGTISGKDDRR